MKKKSTKWDKFFKPDTRKILAAVFLAVVSLVGLSIPSLYGHVIPDSFAQSSVGVILPIVILFQTGQMVALPITFAYLYVLSCLLVWFYERAFE